MYGNEPVRSMWKWGTNEVCGFGMICLLVILLITSDLIKLVIFIGLIFIKNMNYACALSLLSHCRLVEILPRSSALHIFQASATTVKSIHHRFIGWPVCSGACFSLFQPNIFVRSDPEPFMSIYEHFITQYSFFHLWSFPSLSEQR